MKFIKTNSDRCTATLNMNNLNNVELDILNCMDNAYALADRVFPNYQEQIKHKCPIKVFHTRTARLILIGITLHLQKTKGCHIGLKELQDEILGGPLEWGPSDCLIILKPAFKGLPMIKTLLNDNWVASTTSCTEVLFNLRRAC